VSQTVLDGVAGTSLALGSGARRCGDASQRTGRLRHLHESSVSALTLAVRSAVSSAQRAFSEFRLRSPESTGFCRWESMTPRDHPAEEREAGTLAPAVRSAATVGRSYAFQEVAENREEDEPAKRT
jgi:hypothetical protein